MVEAAGEAPGPGGGEAPVAALLHTDPALCNGDPKKKKNAEHWFLVAVVKIKMLYAQSRRAHGVEDKPGLP